MRISEFDYELPEDRIAQRPADAREDARLLVHERGAGRTHHSGVRELARWLRAGDLFVVNDTRVVPARLHARRASGGRVEVLLVERAPGSGWRWRAMLSPARKLREGERLALHERGAVRLGARGQGEDGRPGFLWEVTLEDEEARAVATEAEGEALLERVGRMPLPPYVARSAERREREEPLDRERYQTVYAAKPGAIAAPTAGLHLTERLLGELRARGVERASVTLHVGPGTFRPVKAERIEDHAMHSERFELPEGTARAVAACRARGGRVVAVGTTTARVLESCADVEGRVRAGGGETSLFLRPGRAFRVVDALLTNFHLPRSTLLVLVCAFAGRERTLALYREAIERGYRFYSYGDAMLLL